MLLPDREFVAAANGLIASQMATDGERGHAA